MASSSSVTNSQFSPRWKYDVFISFRGEDTRRTFTSHLYQGLRSRGIFTFQDDKRLEHGTSISEELLKAIEESQVALIVFSTNYATSCWCLDELVKIMKCKIQYGQKVIPIFYDVDPSTVRHQKDSFAQAFAKHEARHKDDVEGMQKVDKWRTALTDAANLSGHDIRGRIESDFILQFVNQISSQSCNTSLAYLEDVGIDAHLEKLKSLLEMQIDDVRIVGIWGMGGVGKTTIATALFNTISNQFEVACFLKDVKENKCGIHSLQNTLLSDLLTEKANYVNNKEAGKRLMAHRFRLKKVLVVLDDIDHEDHLEYLAGELDWFGNGSRILATTRDKHLMGKNDVVYKVTPLVDHEAIQLFNQHAFKKEVPDACFEKLTWEVVSYAKGLPLALKVWGSFLHKRDIIEWRRTIDRIKKNSSSEIVDKLKISYDGLEPEEQKIFLDIACLFRGHLRKRVLEILESCDFVADIGLRVLIEKSLVFISETDTIEMHDLIQDMGRYIVSMQKDSGAHSRLRRIEDFEEVMINNGTKAVEAIWFCNCRKLYLSKKGFKKMKELRIFCIKNYDFWCSPMKRNYVMDGSIEYVANTLRWFIWDYYPFKSLPINFEPKRLVHLELCSSSLLSLWTVTKDLSCLRSLNLNCSKSLILTPNFTGMPNLEYLNLSRCESLVEVHDSLKNCNKLIQLDLNHCKSLKRFRCVNVESLKYLGLQLCSSLEKFPEILGRIKLDLVIDMWYCGIRELPSYIQYQTHLTELNLSGLQMLVALPSSICRFKSLITLNVSFCLQLESLPEEIGDLESLITLNVSSCSRLESLPEEIGDLESLEVLDAKFTLISRPPPSIICLNKLKSLSFAYDGSDAVHFVFPQVFQGLHSLKILDLSDGNLIDGGLPEDIGCLSTLEELYLGGNNFEHLPQSLAQLGNLRFLGLADCKRLNELPELPPNIHTVHADLHVALKSIRSLASKYKKLTSVGFTNLNYNEEDIFAESLFRCISLCQRVICIEKYPLKEIPSWFPRQGMDESSLCSNLPANWHANFLGFVIWYSGYFEEFAIELLPSSSNTSWVHVISQKSLARHSTQDILFLMSMKMYFILCSYHLLVYGIHQRQTEQHQMTMTILSFLSHLTEIES